MIQRYDREAIKQRYNDGEPLQFVFFWGPGESKLPKACFNQWHNAAFHHNNFLYANAEQAMMAEKAYMFKDFGTLQQILDCVSPRAVKALGRMVQNYNDTQWAAGRLQLVVDINYEKFSQNHDMRENLLATGQSILVEASPVDQVWGIGLVETNDWAKNPNLWRGTNLLGEALMIVREQLRQEEDDDV